MATDYIGIDLGSSQLRIYSSKKDEIIFQQPNCISYNVNTKKIDSYGTLASKSLDRTLSTYYIVNPLANGLVKDDESLYDLIKIVCKEKKVSTKCNILFSTPSKRNKVNEDVLRSIGYRLKAKKVTLSSHGELTAYGENENIDSPQAMLVVNIGSQLTDISVLSLGQVIASSYINIASDTFDETIRRYMIKDRHLEISKDESEKIKIMIGDVSENISHKLFEVKGKDTLTSLPSSVIVTSEEINKILIPLVNYIVMEISDVIYSLSSTFATDVVKSGILLSGGGSLLNGLKENIKNALSIPIRQSKNSKDCEILGIKNKILTIKEESK